MVNFEGAPHEEPKLEKPEEEHLTEEHEIIEILDQNIEAIDIFPEHVKTEVPVLLAPGWGGTVETFKESLEEMAHQGRRALSLSHFEKGNVAEEDKEKYPAAALGRAAAILELLEERKIDKVDAVVHSMGGVDVAIAASLHPEKFKSLFLIDPGGLIGEDKFPKLAGRFSMQLIQGTIRSFLPDKPGRRLTRSGWEIAKYIAGRPKKALEEAVDISRSDILGMLKDLHDKGIKIFVMHGVDDVVFPMEKLQKTLETIPQGEVDMEHFINPSENYIDGLYSVKGGHDEFNRHPEKYARIALGILDSQESKDK